MIRLLEGVRVVECAVLFNGDQTGRLLGDLGATVVKVEAPGVGDYLRDFLGQITPHHSPAHMYVNRNKRSMTLDLRSEAGRQVFFELIKTADMFVDGFAGDACARLGIGYEQQRAVKPDIIYAQCSGFGAHGPYASIPTHGQMMGALGGGVKLETGADGLVNDVGGLGDGTVVGATNTALTALAALIRRDRTGEGAYIDGAGSDAVLATQWFFATYAWNDDRITDRRGMAGGGSQRQVPLLRDERRQVRAVLWHRAEVLGELLPRHRSPRPDRGQRRLRPGRLRGRHRRLGTRLGRDLPQPDPGRVDADRARRRHRPRPCAPARRSPQRSASGGARHRARIGAPARRTVHQRGLAGSDRRAAVRDRPRRRRCSASTPTRSSPSSGSMRRDRAAARRPAWSDRPRSSRSARRRRARAGAAICSSV